MTRKGLLNRDEAMRAKSLDREAPEGVKASISSHDTTSWTCRSGKDGEGVQGAPKCRQTWQD